MKMQRIGKRLREQQAGVVKLDDVIVANLGGLGMAGEWVPIHLGKVCTKIGSGATPRGGSDVYLRSGPYSLIRSQNVYNDGFHHNGLAYIGEKHAAELDGVEVHENDVLLNITGDSVARACQVDPDVLPARVNQHVAIIRPDPEKLDPRFLRYFLVSPKLQTKLLSWAGSGGTRNALTKSMIESFDVLAPKGINEQRAIAHILGTLDDKIELNQRMNETLEAMARALFKSWFVDFDPVRAKCRGEPMCSPQSGQAPKSDHAPQSGQARRPAPTEWPQHILDLFPDRLVDSGLGEIPEGWEIGTLEDRSSLNPETWSKKTRPPTINYVDLSNTKWGRIEVVTKYPQEEAPSRAQRVLRPGDTIVGTVRPGNGSYAFVSEDGLTGSTGFAALRPTRAEFAEFVYLAATQRENIEALSHLADGGAYPAVRPDTVAATQIVGANADVLKQFSRYTGPLLEKAAQNGQEARTLAALRDTLLQKLISGELRVDDVEKFVGRVN